MALRALLVRIACLQRVRRREKRLEHIGIGIRRGDLRQQLIVYGGIALRAHAFAKRLRSGKLLRGEQKLSMARGALLQLKGGEKLLFSHLAIQRQLLGGGASHFVQHGLVELTIVFGGDEGSSTTSLT